MGLDNYYNFSCKCIKVISTPEFVVNVILACVILYYNYLIVSTLSCAVLLILVPQWPRTVCGKLSGK